MTTDRIEQEEKKSEINSALWRRFGEGIRQFNLVCPGDHILIGLSGGKDSMALLELLSRFRCRHNRNFRLTALHVRMENVDYRTDVDYLRDFSQRHEVDFLLATAAFEPDRKTKRSPCFLCSWTRRKILFKTAQSIGCNKIALGHHADDILRTALMNLTYSGTFTTMPVRLTMKKMPLTIIRPLCRMSENDLRRMAQERGYRPIDKVCPYDRISRRTDIECLYNEMLRLNPEAGYSLWHALEKAGVLTEESYSVSLVPGVEG